MSRAAAALIIAGYFLILTWTGLGASLHPDDISNLHRAVTEFQNPRAWLSVVWPCTTIYRPIGAVYYLILYRLFELWAPGFRIAAYVLLLLNIGLAFLLAKRFTGRYEAAILTALIFAYHHRFVDIYGNNGTVYDLLAFTFSALAILAWMADQSRPFLSLACFIAALNSKEIAATVPAILLAFHLIFCKRPTRNQIVAVFAMFLMLAGAAWTKQGKGSALEGNSAYQMHVTAAQFFQTQTHFFDALFQQQDGAIPPSGVLVIWGLMAAIALATRSRPLLLATAWTILTPLPVAFIEPRQFFAVYLPYFGWSLFAATAIASLPRTRPQFLATAAATLALLCLIPRFDPYVTPSRPTIPRRPVSAPPSPT